MTRFDLQFLRIGDCVTIKRGRDIDRKAVVLDILGADDEHPCILIRSLDGKPFIENGNRNRRFKLTGWRELDVTN